jgi:hypothetical protein
MVNTGLNDRKISSKLFYLYSKGFTQLGQEELSEMVNDIFYVSLYATPYLALNDEEGVNDEFLDEYKLQLLA